MHWYYSRSVPCTGYTMRKQASEGDATPPNHGKPGEHVSLVRPESPHHGGGLAPRCSDTSWILIANFQNQDITG
jgi:hypothetical protein